jgi:hypothetical protein
MLAPLQIFDGKMEDTLKVLVPNAVILAAINAMTIKSWLEVALLSLSIAYTLWRWRRESYANCERCRGGTIPSSCPLPVSRRPWWCPKKV